MQLDVKTAFLYPDLEDEIDIHGATAYRKVRYNNAGAMVGGAGAPSMVFRLKKKIIIMLLHCGFVKSGADSNLYTLLG